MGEHTPGPWKVIRLDGETYINPSRESGEYALLAKVHPPRGSAWPGGGRTTQKVEANAALIAAAPDLLAAAQAALEHWGTLPSSAEMGTETPGRVGDLLSAAIAKATQQEVQG